MEIIEIIKELLFHTKDFLADFVSKHGLWIYGLLFIIVFCETGLIVFPLLPGDSLLFTAGFLAGNTNNNLDVFLIIILLIFAALLGDNTNYFVGKFLAKKGEGAKLFGIFTIRRDYLDKTNKYYEIKRFSRYRCRRIRNSDSQTRRSWYNCIIIRHQ